MKIEYHEKGATACPLLRIYDFDEHELQELQTKCFELYQGRGNKDLLAGPPQKGRPEDCAILSKIVDQDQGLCATKVVGLFVLCLTNEGWLAASEKLQPLIEKSTGFQWLSDQGEIKLLVSYDGRW